MGSVSESASRHQCATGARPFWRRVLTLSSRLTAATAVVTTAIIGTAASGSAHFADVTASSDCTATVTFSSTAWEGSGTPGSARWVASRTNPTIEVAWGTGGREGAFTVLPQKATYHFDSDNHFQFADSFTPEPRLTPATVVTVRIRALAAWRNGAVSASPRYTETAIPARCTHPSVEIACPDSFIYGQAATLTAVPIGYGPFAFRWALNDRVIGKATTAKVSVTLASRADELKVMVTDSQHQTASAVAECHGSYKAPAVSIACPKSFVYGQPAVWTATASHDAKDDLTYQWFQGGQPIRGATSESVTTIVESPVDELSVTVTDSQDQTASAVANCAGVYTPPAVSIACPASMVYGQPATWTAAATHDANDALAYQWFTNGQAITGATSASVTTTLHSTADKLSVTVTDSQHQMASAAANCAGGPVSSQPTTTPPKPTTALRTLAQPPTAQLTTTKPPAAQPTTAQPPVQALTTAQPPVQAPVKVIVSPVARAHPANHRASPRLVVARLILAALALLGITILVVQVSRRLRTPGDSSGPSHRRRRGPREANA